MFADNTYDIFNMSGCRIFIGRLSPSAREKDVERFFKGYGRIRDIDLKKGFGFVVSHVPGNLLTFFVQSENVTQFLNSVYTLVDSDRICSSFFFRQAFVIFVYCHNKHLNKSAVYLVPWFLFRYISVLLTHPHGKTINYYLTTSNDGENKT